MLTQYSRERHDQVSEFGVGHLMKLLALIHIESKYGPQDIKLNRDTVVHRKRSTLTLAGIPNSRICLPDRAKPGV